MITHRLKTQYKLCQYYSPFLFTSRLITMNQSSLSSAESFDESRKTLLTDYSRSSECRIRRVCRSRSGFRYSAIISWLLSMTLLVLLVVVGSTSGSQNCVAEGF